VEVRAKLDEPLRSVEGGEDLVEDEVDLPRLEGGEEAE
jgi:hypothetical protein